MDKQRDTSPEVENGPNAQARWILWIFDDVLLVIVAFYSFLNFDRALQLGKHAKLGPRFYTEAN